MNEISQPDVELLSQAIQMLKNRFQNIRIFVNTTNYTNSETVAVNVGAGNRYAMIGQVGEWLEIERKDSYGTRHECECGDDQES